MRRQQHPDGFPVPAAARLAEAHTGERLRAAPWLGWVKALLDSAYDQPDAASAHTQFDRIVDVPTDQLPVVPSTSRLPGTTFGLHRPRLWRQICSNGPQKR
jgi:hypothetical protein